MRAAALIKWTLPLLLILPIVLLVITPDAESSASSAARNPNGLRRVRVVAVDSAQTSRQLRFAGTLRAGRRAALAFTVGGKLISRPAEIGDKVGMGQLLAKLDDEGYRNELNTARAIVAESEARLEQLERDYTRESRLVEAKAATREELERIGARRQTAQASLQAARSRLSETERLLAETQLRSPFDGSVVAVWLEPGEFAGPGRPILTIGGSESIELEVEIPESLLSQVSAGDRVLVELPMTGKRVSAVIKSLGSAAERPGRLFPLVAVCENSPGLLAGMAAELRLDIAEDAMAAVPVEAVVNPGGSRPAVYRVRDERVEKMPVTIGGLVGGKVTIRGELEPGDWVVVGGHAGLLDHERVEVMQ